jgi:hypothetical protein
MQTPEIQANQKARSNIMVMILTRADHPLQEGLKVMNALPYVIDAKK